MQASVLQGLERRSPVFAQSDDLPVEHDLLDLLVTPRDRDAGIHLDQVFVVARAELDNAPVLSQVHTWTPPVAKRLSDLLIALRTTHACRQRRGPRRNQRSHLTQLSVT